MQAGLQDSKGQVIDLYIPRKCSWTKRLITSDDYAAVQINVGDVDAVTGKYTGTYKTYAICGYLRDKGESDMALTAMAITEEKKKQLKA